MNNKTNAEATKEEMVNPVAERCEEEKETQHRTTLKFI